ncbi:RNA dependent RNA polymerase-domain-containing protein [Suillus clintonianus]|uniref:RNA dependent RNA polymerase-domain-containing protein n=1 Tax=Suillus clintonianus TaxID=1904413 RepID=UPI001B85CC0A|nr:RNA dependent RNA polymerase-domain-containing protein [Suillus clintonianus]KAG2154722.1 RNA dependent RNA polymerase-domain-containing protein [Suillus clintonianus]
MSRGMPRAYYREVQEEVTVLDEWELEEAPYHQEPDYDIIPALPLPVERCASSDSISSTQSSVYSGLEDLSDMMCNMPEEVFNGTGTSSTSRVDIPMVSHPSIVTASAQPLSAMSASSSDPASPPSSWSSILGKRKTEEPPDTSLSSRKSARIGDATIKIHSIAHDRNLQAYFDSKNIPFGVQWLIAKLVTYDVLAYEDINIPDLDKLRGTNQEAAPRVAQVFACQNSKGEAEGYFVKEKAVLSPWKELDREHELAFAMGDSFDGFQRQADGWYGGKVHFGATLKAIDKKTTTPEYRIQLSPPELGPSSRLARQYGSKNFLRVKVPRNILNKSQHGLVEFFSQHFLLCGLVYRAFYAKDGTVFLVATNSSTGCGRIPSHAHPTPPSLEDFLEWHNPLYYNAAQTVAKWSSRFALGLSNSVPGITISRDNIIYLKEDDPGGPDMTDGCGYINKIALKALRELLQWDTLPTAIQCRIAGAKGLLLLHPDSSENCSDVPRVWLRPSQIKVKYPPTQKLSPGHLTIDVLRSSHMRSPSHLAAETIVNFAENGVPHSVFIDLMKEGLDVIVNSLLDWKGPDAMYRLWHSVARAGAVVSSRLAREVGGEARSRGFAVKDDDIEDDDEDDLNAVIENPRSVAWWGDEVSGCPSSLEETVMVMLDSGFTPDNCPVLAEKLRHVLKTMVDKYVQRYKIEVPMSCVAWIVPDPSGTLAPDEVQILSRDSKFRCPDGTESNVVLGDVLLTRHPCKLPTDTQKVRAVEKPELRQYTDVIVCSVQGTRRFADLLAGGDYDGDKAIAVWQPSIVSHFKNANLRYSHPPDDLSENFHKNTLRVDTLLEQHQGSTFGDLIPHLQSFMLGGLRDISSVGKYSNLHDVAVYTLGYAHKETIRLAYMFCDILDGAKSGLTVLPEVVKSDTKLYQKRSPEWKEIGEEKPETNEINVQRPRGMTEFVMDAIMSHARKYRDLKMQEVDSAFRKPHSHRDSTLEKPWQDAESRVRRVKYSNDDAALTMQTELSKIREHVEKIREEHKKNIRRNFSGLKIERRQDILRSLARDFVAAPDLSSFLFFSSEEVARLKASYAYIHDCANSSGQFPWDVAMRELGMIKAKSFGPSKTVALGFYERFVLTRSAFH